jgi:hypothetical protein
LEKKYTIKDHGDGKTYDITEEPETYTDSFGYIHTNKAIPITEAARIHQQTKSTDELIAEARSLIEYNKRNKQEPKQEPTKTKYEKELEQSAKQWNEYYRNNPSKIRYNIFQEIEKALDY